MKPEKPSDFEMQILGTLWRHGPSTVREVLERLPDEKERAYTSVLSVMQVMEKKRLLTRKREGIADRWRPAVKEEEVIKPLMRRLVSHVFGGRAAGAMQCLLSEAELDRDEIAEIRDLLDRYTPPEKP